MGEILIQRYIFIIQQLLLHGIVTSTTHTAMNTAAMIDEDIQQQDIQQQQQDQSYNIDHLSLYEPDVMIRTICIECIRAIQQQQNVIRYKEFYEQIQLLLITTNATNTSRDENHTNKQKLLPLLPEYDTGWVNRMEHDNSILYDTYVVRLQTSQSHLN